MKIPTHLHPLQTRLAALALGAGLSLTAVPCQTSYAADKPGAQAESASKFSEGEKHFIHKARGGNAAEVMSGELALKNAERKDVREFAQKMIDDHKKANDNLAAVEREGGLEVKEPEIPADAKKMYEHLSTLKGKEFDDAYVHHMVADHKEDVNEYKEEKGKVKETGLSAYVEQTLPIIEGHLKMIEGLAAKK